MAERDVNAEQALKQARKLQELFSGRFSEEESLDLLNEHGGLSEAVDFVLNGDPAEVRRLLYDRNKAFVEKLRKDSEYVNMALNEGPAATIRLFACQPCDRYWWRKVPARKEVSKCKLCKVKYDAVPKDQEWGQGEFVCVCKNVFIGKAWMNHTKSPCYKCGFHASPRQILPPIRRPEQRRSRARHSCDANNCYNKAHGTPSFTGRDKDAPICPHENSGWFNRVLYPSPKHVSTGSTVNTFMSQGELAEEYEDMDRMPSVVEVDVEED